VGYNTSRGDMVTVQDMAFEGNRTGNGQPVAQQILGTVEHSPVLVKYLALILGVLLVLVFGVRPALRQAAVVPAGGKTEKKGAKELPAAAPAQAALSPPAPAEVDEERVRTQEIFEQVTSHLKREPTQSSRLLQSWIHSD